MTAARHMKRILQISLVVAAVAGAATFADEPLSAEQAWNRISILAHDAAMQNPTTDAQKTAAIDQLSDLANSANEFWQLYPDNPHMWEAKLMVLQATLERANLEGKQPNVRLIESDVREITADNGAPLPVQAEAAYWLLQLHARVITEARDASKLATLDAEAAEYARRYPQAQQSPDAAWLRLAAYETLAPEKADALLRQFAQDKDPRVATEAKRRVMIKDLSKKPLELKFTTVDGKDFDMAKLRGKVVLVDFWATWCGPCRMELPNVIGTYKKLHDKGFEIVGISLDRDKNALLQFIKQKELSWPQYYDGGAWENKVSAKYGINAIPAQWLIDKRGIVRSTNARADLEDQVTKLLAE
jgi:thiol-disulfide isomerase/thioredoxin